MFFRLQSLMLLFFAVAIFSRTGTLLLTNNTSNAGPGDLFLYDLRTGVTDTLYKGKARGPSFSPDGKRVAFSISPENGTQYKIHIINVYTRELVSIGKPLAIAPALTWASDGWIYYSPKWGKVLERINVETGVLDTAYRLKCSYFPAQSTDNAGFGDGNVASDGRRAAFTIDNDQRGNRAVFFDFGIGTERTMRDSTRLSCQANISPNGLFVVSANYNHTTCYIQRVSDFSLYASFSIPSVFMTQFSYNDDYQLTARHVNNHTVYHIDLRTFTYDSILNGPVVWTIDSRGWLLDTIPPNAPTELTSKATDVSISLAWHAPAAAQDGDVPLCYVIERNGVIVGTTEKTSYLDKTVLPQTSYQYKIFSKDGGIRLSVPVETTVSTVVDIYPPAVVAAYSIQDSTKIRLVFSEIVDSVSAVSVSRYTINPPITISSVKWLTAREVLLTTVPFTQVKSYRIKYFGIADKAATPNVCGNDSFPLFVLRGTRLATNRVPYWAMVLPDSSYSPDDAQFEKFPSVVPEKYLRRDFLKAWWRDQSFSDTSEYIRFNINRPAEITAISSAGLVYCRWLAGWTNAFEKFINADVFTRIVDSGLFTVNGSGWPSGTDRSANVYMIRALDDSVGGPGTILTSNDVAGTSLRLAGRISASPNPFSSSVALHCFSATGSGKVDVLIHDLQGCLVKKFSANESLGKGTSLFTWQGENSAGKRLPSGLYVIRLVVNGTAVNTSRVLYCK